MGAATGQDTYILIPGFYEKLNPWIVNQTEFSKFIKKYKDVRQISERDKADIIIQLGILQNAPNWLTPHALVLIDKYYPGLRKRRADKNSTQLVRLAQNNRINVISDVNCCRIVVAQLGAGFAPPPVILASSFGLIASSPYVEAIAFVAGINPVILAAIAGGLLVAVAYEEIIQRKQQDCAALGGCNSPAPDPNGPVSAEMAKSGSQNYENEYSREARGYPDPCDWLRKAYQLEKDSVKRQKIKLAQKVLGCRSSSAN